MLNENGKLRLKKDLPGVSAKRWRAELGNTYFYISNEFYIAMTNDLNKPIDKIRYELGNYFKTENVAKRAAEILKETLKKFHGEDK